MKTLDTKEWIAVSVSVFVVGFFFLFGPQLLASFTNNQQAQVMQPQAPELTIKDDVVGAGEEAVSGSRVTVHYVGSFVNGEVFDSSLSRKEPLEFVLGRGQVIEGWEKGLVGMRVGGKRTITIPPELGYGMNDYGPIKGGSTLVFTVELLKVQK